MTRKCHNRILQANPGYLEEETQNTNSHMKVKKKGKDQESIKSSTTPDPGYQWETDNITIRHHKTEQRGQLFPSRWPLGIINRRT